MTIPRVEGWWESIAKPLDQIGNAVADWKNPFRHTQKAVMQRLAMDPGYAQELSQLAKDNPELINRVGLGKMLGTLQQTEASPQRRMQEVAARKSERDEVTDNELFEIDQEFMKSATPEQKVDIGRTRRGLGTLKQEELTDLSIAGQKLQQKLGTLQLQVQHNVFDQQKAEQEADKLTGEFIGRVPSKTNLYALSLSKEGIPQEIREAIFKSPTAMKRFDFDRDNYYRDKGLELDRLRLAAAQNGSRMSLQEYMDRRIVMTSEQLSESLRMNINDVYNLVKTGTPLSAYAKMYQDSPIKTPEQIAQLRQIDPQKAAQLEFGMRFSQMDQATRNKQLGTARREMNSAFGLVQKASQEKTQGRNTQMNVDNAIAAYNDAVNNHNSLLSPGEAQYPQITKTVKGSWLWRSENVTREMKEKDILNLTSIPTLDQPKDQLSQDYENALKRNPGLSAEAFAQEARRVNPQSGTQIDTWLKSRGGK